MHYKYAIYNINIQVILPSLAGRIAIGSQHIVAEALAVRCAYSEVIAVGLELVDGDALEGPGHRVDLYIYIYVEKMYI